MACLMACNLEQSTCLGTQSGVAAPLAAEQVGPTLKLLCIIQLRCYSYILCEESAKTFGYFVYIFWFLVILYTSIGKQSKEEEGEKEILKQNGLFILAELPNSSDLIIFSTYTSMEPLQYT